MVGPIVSHQTYLQDVLARQARRRLKIDPSHIFPLQPTINSSLDAGPSGSSAGQPSKSNVVNYVPEEETIRNDYTAWYGVSGRTGANYILGAGEEEICEEYPALRRLMDLKSALVSSQAHPPLYLALLSPSNESILTNLAPHKFDVILVHPHGTWFETTDLPIRQLSADPGFVFLWVGRGDQDGLERGRECLARWGFRRAEDIVWIKTNRGVNSTPTAELKTSENGPVTRPNHGAGSGGLFSSQKEHCLMGIRGTVRRSTDTRFVHCNVDTDVMVWEQDGIDGPDYPPYLYTLIESFCLGTRRLQLFAPPGRSRRGWVTASTEPLPSGFTISSDESHLAEPTAQNPMRSPTAPLSPEHSAQSVAVQQEVLRFVSTTYPALMPPTMDGRDVLPYHPEIDSLRPKSPQRRGRGGPPSGPGGQGGFRGQSPPPQTSFRGGSFRGGSRGRGGRGGMGNFGQQPQQYPANMGYGQYDQFGQPDPMTGQMYDPRYAPMQASGMTMDPMMAMQMQMQMQQMQQMQMMGMGMGMGMYGMNPSMGQNVGQNMGPGFQGYDPQMGYMQYPQQLGQWNAAQGQGQYGQGAQGQGEWYGGQAE